DDPTDPTDPTQPTQPAIEFIQTVAGTPTQRTVLPIEFTEEIALAAPEEEPEDEIEFEEPQALGAFEEIEVVEEVELEEIVPLANLPKTGDNGIMFAMLLGMFASLIFTAASMTLARKAKKASI
ncbi:MAG: LPXTG cell wall anchor domain-containing protein, partial [Defluviitaleaceae bacterium]|nr:LPXTG cell wall anchor domain-containing protein [Defluviitaleaceae bacterium]